MKKILALVFIWLPVATVLQGQHCPPPGSQVQTCRWQLQGDNLAAFVNRVIDTSGANGLVVFLGSDSTGLYTIEKWMDNDACGCHSAAIAFTAYDGQRSLYPLFNGPEPDRHNPDSLETLRHRMVESKIHSLQQKKLLPVAPLQHDFSIVQHGTSVIVNLAGRPGHYHWELWATSRMCWCFYRWLFSFTDQ